MKVSFICKTHFPPYIPLPSPKDPAHVFTAVHTASPSKTSSDDPSPTCWEWQSAAATVLRNRCWFCNASPLQATPLLLSPCGTFSLHAIQFVTYKAGQGPAGCCTSPLSLGHFVSKFLLPSKALVGTENEQGKEKTLTQALISEGFFCVAPPAPRKFSSVLLTAP